MSKSHRRRRTKIEAVEFASLFRRFEHEYGRAYLRLAAQLRTRYPEITRPGRRTGRALHNIGFFIWCCCRGSDPKRIPALFHAAVLLSAQDDYFDNVRIPAAEKESFSAAINASLRRNAFRRPFSHRFARTPQVRDLTSLWSYVAGTIPRTTPQVRSYWIETACRLNDAMAVENRALRRATITYDDYMRTAIDSIGMVFVWATYLAHEHVRMASVRRMAPMLVRGARVVRLSNDLASYRQQRNVENAVTLMGGGHPDVRLLRLMQKESAAFRRQVDALDVAAPVRGVLLHSMEFLREFYQRSDFHRGPAW